MCSRSSAASRSWPASCSSAAGGARPWSCRWSSRTREVGGRLLTRLASRPEGYRYTLGRVFAVYAALMATLFFAALDQTIVVTALPRIVADVGGLTSYSWIVTAYMLALTVTVPVYGKLVDGHGPRVPFLVAIGLFLVRSALCRPGPTMPELVAF